MWRFYNYKKQKWRGPRWKWLIKDANRIIHLYELLGYINYPYLINILILPNMQHIDLSFVDCELNWRIVMMANCKSDVPISKAGDHRRRSEVEHLWSNVKYPQAATLAMWSTSIQIGSSEAWIGEETVGLPALPPFHHTSYVVIDLEPVVNDPMHADFRKLRERGESRRQKPHGQRSSDFHRNETVKIRIF